MVQKIWGKVKLMFSLSLVHMFSVLVRMCVFFKERCLGLQGRVEEGGAEFLVCDAFLFASHEA